MKQNQTICDHCGAVEHKPAAEKTNWIVIVLPIALFRPLKKGEEFFRNASQDFCSKRCAIGFLQKD